MHFIFVSLPAKIGVVHVRTLAYPGGLCGKSMLPVQNTDKAAEAFPARSPTEVIPSQCCPCIFLLVGVAKKKIFSVSLERGNNALLSRHCAVHSLSQPT